jgi:hypothetical protein
MATAAERQRLELPSADCRSVWNRNALGSVSIVPALPNLERVPVWFEHLARPVILVGLIIHAIAPTLDATANRQPAKEVRPLISVADPLSWLPVSFGALRAPGPQCGRTNEDKVLAAGRIAGQPSDLDALMEKVVARRDENWKKLQQYVLDERETLHLTGPDGGRLYGFRRDYSWFIQQGVFVRSPLRADGVAISEADRRKYEADWIARERRRDQRIRERAEANGAPAQPAAESVSTTDLDAVLKSGLEPRFVSAAYFLRFKFEPGQYALVGRERLLDRDVLRVEYYPRQLFNEGRTRPNRRVRERDEQIEEKMNKISLVTLWVDPAAHQILQYTFDDIDMDFLPGRSLARVDDVRASMRMAQPFPNVWLPATVEIRFRMTLAVGSVDARYDVEYHDYRLADVKMRVR